MNTISGKLYVIATPIGNLADISYRAVECLRSVSLIACEDTRHSRRLLDAYAIKTPLLALHQHNERAQSNNLIAKIISGDSVALISDAGTPTISDPGGILLALAHQQAIKIVAIPGASSVIAALSVSGFNADSFVFAGFIPNTSAARHSFLQQFVNETKTTIFFETPHRIAATLQAMTTIFAAARQLTIAREITKRFEEITRLTIAQLATTEICLKGEFVIVLEGCRDKSNDWQQMADDLRRCDISCKDAAALLAKYANANKKEAYAYLLEKNKS